MQFNSAEKKRWLKNRIKMIQLNTEIYRTKHQFRRADYCAAKEQYEQITQEIIEAIRAYPKTQMSEPCLTQEKKRIVPDSYISIIGDQMGRVFWYQGKIYRGVYKERVPAFEALWRSGILQVLAEFHLIPKVEISDYCTDAFAVVLDTEMVTVQKNTGWTSAMIKDACILITLLKSILNPFGYTLIDGHLNNVVFHNGNPMFIDIGSIISSTDNGFMNELVFAGIYRLAFAFIGNSMMRRLPSHDDANANMRVFPRPMNQLTREYQTALKVMKRYFFLHGGFFGASVVHRVFDLNVFDAQDIDYLFPIRNDNSECSLINDWSETASLLTSLPGISNILTLAGTAGEAEAAIFQHCTTIKLTCIDFNEDRLNRCYQRLKAFRSDTNVFLYNYVYLLDEQAEEITADAVLSVDLLNDRGTFWPVPDAVLAYKLGRFVKRYLLLYYPKDAEAQYRTFFREQLSDRFCIRNTMDSAAENACCMVLEVKNRK